MITVGIDEVGRGCWAGPLLAGAVIMPSDFELPTAWKLGDSKKLSKKQRDQANQEIRKVALAVGIGWVTAAEIDEIGLTAAVTLAMTRGLEQIKIDYDEVIIDGHLNFLADMPKARALIKADDTEPSVSAASIVAKVARDDYMASLKDNYGFTQHVGYGTALHLANLREHGVSVHHRRSFKPIKALLQ
jgi:ribonuclease HII